MAPAINPPELGRPSGFSYAFDARGERTVHFSGHTALDGSGMQPRGKTARELTIGRKLRELREERHLTQQEMAGKAGVPRTYISRIENARLLPGPVMLHRIADALAVAILDLLPQNKNVVSAPELGDDTYWASFVSHFSQLRPGDMAYVVSHVREMLDEDRTPALMPASRAGPTRDEVTMRPLSPGPTVSPTPK